MKVWTIPFLWLLSTTAAGQDEDFKTQCSTVHTMSGMVDIISEERSKTIAEVMEWFPTEVYGKQGHEVILEIVLDWYEQPDFETYDYRSYSEKAFQNKWALQCYKDHERFRFWK